MKPVSSRIDRIHDHFCCLGTAPEATALFLFASLGCCTLRRGCAGFQTFFVRYRSHVIIDPEAAKTHAIAP
jgi:hypothetical protein